MKKFAVLTIALSALAISSQANAVHIRRQQPPPTITGTTHVNFAVPDSGKTLLLLAGALAAMFALRRRLAR